VKPLVGEFTVSDLIIMKVSCVHTSAMYSLYALSAFGTRLSLIAVSYDSGVCNLLRRPLWPPYVCY
jgi:hypothetical protein